MKTISILSAALVTVIMIPTAAFAWGSHNHDHRGHETHQHVSRVPNPTPAPSPAPTPSPTPTPPPAPTPIPAPTGNGSIALENVWLTGYADADNTPAGSPVTDLDGHHGTAGGDCTYSNPTTLAVGHVITNGVDKGDFAYGTKFYVPALKCYFQAADTCGDGPTPQNESCHKPEQGSLQLDLYVGPGGNASCESNMTNIYSVIENPLPGLPVNQGFICK